MAEDGKKSRGFVLGDISPLAGIISGEGLTSSLLGGLPALLGGLRNRGGEEEEETVNKGANGMAKGGPVKGKEKNLPPWMKPKGGKPDDKKAAGKPKPKPFAAGGKVRGCGIATRGLTKGRMR